MFRDREGLHEIICPFPVPSPRDKRERNDDQGQKRRCHRYSVHPANHTIPIDYRDRRSVNYLDHSQYQNSFVVLNGQIVDGGFWAAQTINGFFAGFQLFLHATAALEPYNYLNLDGTNAAYIWGNNGLAAAHFTPAANVPEPAGLVLAALGVVGIAGWNAQRRHSAAKRP
jgi:hypothetical protein